MPIKPRKDIAFPILPRQAQKLVWQRCSGGARINLAPLCEAMGVDYGDWGDLHDQLSRLAQKDPNRLIQAPGFEEEEKEGQEQEEGATEANPLGAEPPADAFEQREVGEERNKGTDEVRPQSNNPSDDSPYHGGDGNSGECDHRSQTDSQQDAQPPEGQEGSRDPQGLPKGGSERGAAGQPSCPETGVDLTSGSEATAGNSQSPAQQVVPTPSTALGQEGSDPLDSAAGTPGLSFSEQPRDAAQPESGDSQDSDPESDQCDSSESETNPSADCPAQRKKWGKPFKGQGQGQVSAEGKNSHGGVTAELKKIGINAKLLRLCRQRLANLAGDSWMEFSPRRDWAEFCTRLKTYRNPAPARKEEQGRPCLWVMADVSGSCAGFSHKSLAVAKACSKLGVPGADIVVIAHSNGYPEEAEVNGKYYTQSDKSLYESLISLYPPQVVVALGDWDAEGTYRWLGSLPCVERLIWLDNAYSSRLDKPRNRTRWALAKLRDPKLRAKLIYRDGCKDAIDFIDQIKG